MGRMAGGWYDLLCVLLSSSSLSMHTKGQPQKERGKEPFKGSYINHVDSNRGGAEGREGGSQMTILLNKPYLKCI